MKNTGPINQLFPGDALELLRDFGPQPVSNRFPEKPSEGEFFMPMELAVCPRSGLVQLVRTFPPEELQPRVPWLNVFEPEGHLDDLADKLATLPGLTPEDWVAGYSSKDDSLLRRLGERGFTRQWRLDPARDLGIANPSAFVETFQTAFVAGAAANAVARAGKPKIFLVRHVLEHSYDLLGFLRATRNLIHPDGYVVFEIPDCERAFENLDYTTLWEEHSVYFTTATFLATLKHAGLEPILFDIVPHPFENCMIAVCRAGAYFDAAIDETALFRELERARRFAAEFENVTSNIQTRLEKCRQLGLKMALFGAGHLAVAFAALHRVGGFFEFVIDDNPHKCGRHLAGCGLPIRPSPALVEKNVDICLLALNPEHENKIIAKNEGFSAVGGRFGSVFPSSPRCFFA